MKYTKLLSATVLGAMTLGMVTPAFAAVEPAVGDGTIEFTEDTSTEGQIDPENPGGSVTPEGPDEGNKTGQTGPLQIVWVSNLKFGSMPASLNGIKADAAATKLKDADGQPISRGNYVQVADKRFNEDPGQGWTLSAELTKQFTEVAADGNDGKTVLKGSTITYDNANVEESENQKEEGVEPVKPAAAATAPVLAFEGGSVDMLTAGVGKGFGNWTVEYGDSRKGTEASSVHLNVPSRVAMKATNYKAEITWTLSEL